MTLPPGALGAALAARAHALADRPTPTVLSDEALMRQTLEAAAPYFAAQAAAAERQRIRQLADAHEARRACLECGGYGPDRNPCRPPAPWFADLLEDPPPGGTA